MNPIAANTAPATINQCGYSIAESIAYFAFAFSPISTSRRMASEREAVSFFLAQLSISLVRSTGSRTAETGS